MHNRQWYEGETAETGEYYQGQEESWKHRSETVETKINYSIWNKGVESGTKTGIIKSLAVDDFESIGLGKEIEKEVLNVISETINSYEKKGEMLITDVHQMEGNRRKLHLRPTNNVKTEKNATME